MRSPLPCAAALLCCLFPLRGVAQVPLFLTGSVGGAFNINSNDPVAGNGFSFLAGFGLRYPSVAFGAEFGQHDLGPERLRQYGVFARIPAYREGPVRPYAAVGLADYRFGPASGGGDWAIGGSVGPGAMFSLFGPHATLLLEARLHTTFRGIGTISNPEFLAAVAGLELAL